YTFTPDAGQCAEGVSIQITVGQDTPSFATIADFCEGDIAPILPSTSSEGYTGTWSPSLVSNTASGTYTFTPDAGQCATQSITITINVIPNVTPSFDPVVICAGDTAPMLPSTSLEGITGTWFPLTVDNMAT